MPDSRDGFIEQLFYEEEENHRLATRGIRRAVRPDAARIEEIERRLAATAVREQCNEHKCAAKVPGECDHPMHRQHVDYMAEMLAMLGLPQERPSSPEADRKEWLAGLRGAEPPGTAEAA